MGSEPRPPAQTSTLALEGYAPQPPNLSSVAARWPHLIARTFAEPPRVDGLVLPAVPDAGIVLLGTGTMRLERRAGNSSWSALLARAGDLFVTPPGGESHEYRWASTSDAPIETFYLHLDARLLGSMAEEAGLGSHRVEILDRAGVRDPVLEALLRALQRELGTDGRADRIYVETAARMVAVQLLRQHSVHRPGERQRARELSPARLLRTTEYVLAHLDRDIGLDDLASQAGISAYHFARLFKASTGESPHQYVLRRRLEAAQRLLRETDLPVAQLSLELGFSSQSHFAARFRRAFGLTPGAYRAGGAR